ncbi:hypothetical protein BKP35_17630 [Anaerobacillus arseniciselenatis]|uniref:Uncharacterized protein n=1 Tax=Anaerobacillus arseniciselenatis TaxID=85682 RepID=A0A1S2L7R0_9BACI|nr:hypothetical protein [Anaerobacillus arseniciselenatis]OIJ08539.1 hypothetical protein BKP35_17630 [Anaerobacillus arseniciselenatis]
MGYVIAIVVIWIIGVIGVISERNNPFVAKLEPHEKLRITGLTFLGFAMISSIPAIAVIVLALRLGL